MRRAAAIALVALAACGGKRERARVAFEIDVRVEAPGLAAEEVESAIATPIEHALGNVRDVVGMRGESVDGRATIAIAFGGGEPLAAIHAIEEHMPLKQLPPGVQPPMVSQHVGPIALRYELHSDALERALVAEIGERLREKLARQDGVGLVERCGDTTRELNVTIDPVIAEGAGVAIDDVRTALDKAARPATSEGLRALIVMIRNGAPTRLGDVAQVVDGVRQPACNVLDRRGPIVEGIVRAQPGADPARVRETAMTALAAARAELPASVQLAPIATHDAIAIALPPESTLGDRFELARRALAAANVAGAVVELRDDVARVLVDRDAERIAASISRDLPVRAVVEDDAAPWLRVLGPDRAQLVTLGAALADAAARVPGVTIVAREGWDFVTVQRVDVDRAAAARFGIDARTIADVLAARAGGLRIGGSGPPVVLRVADAPLDRAFVRGSDGTRVPLAQLAHVSEARALRTIVHVDGSRAAGVRVHVADDEARAALRAEIARVALPAGYVLRSDL